MWNVDSLLQKYSFKRNSVGILSVKNGSVMNQKWASFYAEDPKQIVKYMKAFDFISWYI